MSNGIVKTIKKATGLKQAELMEEAMESLVEKKTLELQANVLEFKKKYNVNSVSALKKKIAQKKVEEHPAWEDLIVWENLEAKLKELSKIQKAM